MTSSAWEKFPVEVVSNICELLYHEHYSSLVNFARSKKVYYAIATTFLARTLRIFGDDAKTLALSVQEHVERLHRDEAFKYVHHLIIFSLDSERLGWRGGHHDTSSDYTDVRHCYASIKPHYSRIFRDMLPPVCDVDFDTRFENLGLIQPRDWDMQQIDEVDEDWRPLADLIKQLSYLTDLIYHCPGLVPPCVLQTLHEHQPQCRLHIDDFQLDSLSTESPILDSREFMVVTSPCLYSINLQISRYFGDHEQVHIFRAVQRIAARLAPNLKEVHLRSDWNGLWGPDEEHFSVDPLWGHLDVGLEHPGPSGLLSCLQVHGPNNNAITVRALAGWGMHTNFAALQTLEFDSPITKDALESLASAPHGFPSLKTLRFVLEKPRELGESESASQYYELVTQVISRLQGLHTLEIKWWHRDIDFGTVLPSELQILRLWSCRGGHPTARDVTQIRERCPFLTDLTLTILRSKGDANETAVYRELGALPRLQRLSLEMDALLPPPILNGYLPPDPSFDDYDREPSGIECYLNGHFRDAFINGAMDKSLALDIFVTISRAKPNDHSIPLQKLVIRFNTLSDYQPPDLREYRTEFHCPWQIERSLRDDSCEPLVAREFYEEAGELGKSTRQFWLYIEDWEGKVPDTDNLDSIFRRIWPERSKGHHWREDWRSFPLS
ncbi:hypothetical protein K449DRAFT_404191 [Hypoxylon sp. EC38]|nr:hypothetical protein K449DRAFT_404191 [Hypoxylon sp. EC38]